MYSLEDIDNHFPIRVNGKASYREGQRTAIEFALKAFNSGKKIVIIEGPTGSGKSAIGMTIADIANRSYYLTATKILQDQLTDEFKDKIIELKGRNAYPCTLYDRVGPEFVKRGVWTQSQLDDFLSKNSDCATGFCKTNAGKSLNKSSKVCLKCFPKSDGGELQVLPVGMKHSACPYYDQVGKAIEHRKVVMNFSSFLYQTQMTKRFAAPRDVLVIDEAHQCEPQLLDFVSLTISDANLQKHGVIIPQLSSPEEYALFFEDVGLTNVIAEAASEASKNDDVKLASELLQTSTKYRMFVDYIKNDVEWVSEYETTKSQVHKVTLKPVNVYGMVHNLLFKHATNIVMMSATILDVDIICKSLGIKRDHVAAIRLKNRFPVENRPIFYKPAGKFTGGNAGMMKWGSSLINGVNKIVSKYPNKKGIIHTHNFAISNLIKERCSGARDRFLFQHDFGNDKKKMLEEHSKRSNSIIVAPAMHEGIDLNGDLSRFQIICKVPYPNCFDNKQLARRVEIDRRYYTWLTALKIVQSYGRSIRSETDYADTYILDEAFERFAKDAKGMFPDWFLEAIKW